jgi:hypothetical protein
MQYGIAPEDIYNFNEISFAIGIVDTALVVTRADYYSKASVIQPGNQE